MRAAALGCVVLSILVSACMPSPQRAQSRDLLDQLTQARGMLAQHSQRDDACASVGDVETRLYGEPGLTSVQPAWSQLANAAHALQSVCGQTLLLAQPSIDSVAVSAAQQRWTQGIERELGVACDHLRAAAQALDRPAPC